MERPENLTMPNDFKYKKTYDKGKPVHGANDPFCIKHPKMDLSRRAKIFAPFDALRGFDAAVIAKNEVYEIRQDADDEVIYETGQKLCFLHELTKTVRMAMSNRIRVSVTFFDPCGEACDGTSSEEGKYRTVTGICLKVDPDIKRSILVDETVINFDDIKSIEILGSSEQPELL
ncbi:MAG: hypothetical protein K5770_19870 [Lachnospiraceae bacterium]|nr:hypothetical protein [Lachnospiraceae bacterium]